MSGHEEGGCSRQAEQQCERHGSEMISWIVLTHPQCRCLQGNGKQQCTVLYC